MCCEEWAGPHTIPRLEQPRQNYWTKGRQQGSPDQTKAGTEPREPVVGEVTVGLSLDIIDTTGPPRSLLTEEVPVGDDPRVPSSDTVGGTRTETTPSVPALLPTLQSFSAVSNPLHTPVIGLDQVRVVERVVVHGTSGVWFGRSATED